MYRLATTPAPLCFTTCSRGRLFVYLILLYWFVLPPLSGPDTIRNGLSRASIQKSRHRRGARIENKYIYKYVCIYTQLYRIFTAKVKASEYRLHGPRKIFG